MIEWLQQLSGLSHRLKNFVGIITGTSIFGDSNRISIMHFKILSLKFKIFFDRNRYKMVENVFPMEIIRLWLEKEKIAICLN